MKTSLTVLLAFFLIQTATLAQEWVRQHPFERFAPLHAVTFDENGNGWAVGQQSLILHTENWGALWTLQGEDLPIGYTFEAVEIVPGTNSQVILVGGPGVFASFDGGESWEFLSTGTHVDAVKRIQAFNPTEIVISGRSVGVITTNGGQDWTSFEFPDNSASAAWFTDTENGWAGAGPFNAYQLYRTTNGGADWTLADDALYPIITDITMINEQTGFLSGRDYIFKTTNGGADWTQLHNDVQPSLTGMHVVNENIVYSGLNNGFIFYTTNGGADWSQVNPNIIGSNQVFDVFAKADGRVWVPGKYSSIQFAMNANGTWIDQTKGSKNALFDVDFSGNVGYAAGADGSVLRTMNGGAIWENIEINTGESFFATDVIENGSDRTAFVGTSNGKVYQSENDGDDWDIIGTGLGQIRTMHALTPEHIVVGTETALLYTTNGGQNWNTSSVTLSNLVSEVFFPDGQTGYAAVHDGRVLKSQNGGMTWSPVLERDNSYRFSGVHFQNPMIGWAVAEFKDSVWTTQNGGSSWTAYRLPQNTFWQDVAFMNQDTGYISGGSAGAGLVLRTSDGGETWTVEIYEVERLNNTYVRPDEDFVWVVGQGGNILHFSPCSVTPEISDLTGNPFPCEGESAFYEITSEGATLFDWTVPAGWTILGNENTGMIEVLVGAGGGEITVIASNSCGSQTNALSIQVSSVVGGDVAIALDNGTLETELTGVTYQWLRNGEEIEGATDATYTPSVSGLYTLRVTFPNGCTATSNAIDVMISAVRDAEVQRIAVFPNPVHDILRLEIDSDAVVREVIITDLTGKQLPFPLRDTQGVDVSRLHPGLYLLQVATETKILTGKFVKD